MNKPLIIQQATGLYQPLMHYGADLARRFAELSGSDYEPCAYTVGSMWTTEEKFRLPLKFMTGSGRPMLSLDADVLCVGSESWVDALGDADFAAVRTVTTGEFNVGSFMFRDTPQMIAIFVRALRRLPATIRSTGTQYCDQMILNHEIKSAQIKTVWLNRKWNDYARAAGKLEGAIQIKAFHDYGNTVGPSPVRKLAIMKNWKERHDQPATTIQQQHAASTEVCAGPE